MIKHQGRNIKPDSLNINKFSGYNIVDDPSNLPSGYLVAGSKNVDLTRERGSIGKALGRAALITSVGTGGTTGMFTYQRSSGDIPLFGHGTSLYKLTGSPLTLTKTTDADFNAGTRSGTTVYSDAISLALDPLSPGELEISIATGAASGITFSDTKTFGQTFTTLSTEKSAYIRKIRVGFSNDLSWDATETVTLNLYDSPAKTTLLGSASVTDGNPGPGHYYEDFIFPTSIPVSRNTQYYYEMSLSAPSGQAVEIYVVQTDAYAGGQAYIDGVAQPTKDLGSNAIFVPNLRLATGTYTSQSLDLGQTPATATLAWTETKPANTAIAMQARGSDDNLSWGAWQNVLTGGATPRKRFIQVKATLTTTDTTATPTLSDYTITYTTAYDSATAILTGLSGSHVTGCNYQDNIFFTDGGRPKRWEGTLVAAAINGTFEVNTTGWGTSGTGCSIARITSDKHSGTACMQVTTVAGNGYTVLTVPSIQSRGCKITLWAKSISGNTSLGVSASGDGDVPRQTITTSWAQYTFYSNAITWYGVNVGTAQGLDSVFLVDDVTVEYESIYDVGIDPPLTAPSGVQGAGTGIGAGTYTYKIAYLNDIGGESSLGPASAGVTIIANKSINLTAIPVSPSPSVTAREIYRTKAGGTDYFYVATISNNTATTYTDTTADAALITPPEDDVGLPPLTTTIVYEHKNYMMYASGDKVYFSKVGEPDHVAPLDYKQFPGNVLAMRSFQGALVVGGDTFCHAVFGDIWDSSPTVDDTTVKVVSNSFGPVSHESMQLCNSAIGDILVFPTRRGLSYINQGYQENTVANSILSAEVQPMFDDAISRENMAGMYFNYEYILAMNYAGAETPTTTNNLMMKYDLRENKWNPPIYYDLNGITEAAGMLLGGSSTAGIVYQLNSGNTDATADIHAVAVLSPLATRTKSKFNRARIRVNDGSTTDTLEVKPNVDGVEGTIAVGATSTWSVPTVSPKFRIPCPRGYELQVKVEDDSTNDWIIPAIEVDYEGGVM